MVRLQSMHKAARLPYTYMWSDGQMTQTAIGLVAGNYDVTVTDANGCSTISNAIVASVGGASLTTSSTDELCGQANGTATANATGGTAPLYLYVE